MLGKKAPGIVVCVDPRLDSHEYFTLLPERAYRFSFVGACQGVTTWWWAFVQQIEALEKVGVIIDPLYLIDHTTCKAYGGSESPEDHFRTMGHTARMVAQRFPDKTIHLRLLDMRQKRLLVLPAAEYTTW